MTSEGPQPEVLIIDDEVQIRRLLRLTLETAGYRVREADCGLVGINEVTFRRPDAIVLDLGLPDLAGLDVLKRLREWSKVPILILSVLGQDEKKIAALDSGADDYLTKPFSGGELLARLRVMLRHNKPNEEVKIVKFGAIEVDIVRRVVTRGGREVKLTAKEYGLLQLFVVNLGKVITHRQILRELWGPNAVEQTQYLRVYLGRLRQKLEEDPNRPVHLKTESGIGYRLVSS